MDSVQAGKAVFVKESYTTLWESNPCVGLCQISHWLLIQIWFWSKFAFDPNLVGTRSGLALVAIIYNPPSQNLTRKLIQVTKSKANTKYYIKILNTHPNTKYTIPYAEYTLPNTPQCWFMLFAMRQFCPEYVGLRDNSTPVFSCRGHFWCSFIHLCPALPSQQGEQRDCLSNLWTTNPKSWSFSLKSFSIASGKNLRAEQARLGGGGGGSLGSPQKWVWNKWSMAAKINWVGANWVLI